MPIGTGQPSFAARRRVFAPAGASLSFRRKERKQRKALKTKPMAALRATANTVAWTHPPGGLGQEAYLKGFAALARVPTQAASGAICAP